MHIALVALKGGVMRADRGILVILSLFAGAFIRYCDISVPKTSCLQVVGSHFDRERSRLPPLKGLLGREEFEMLYYFDSRFDWGCFESVHRSYPHCHWPVDIQHQHQHHISIGTGSDASVSTSRRSVEELHAAKSAPSIFIALEGRLTK
jgi:hypothetical protein